MSSNRRATQGSDDRQVSTTVGHRREEAVDAESAATASSASVDVGQALSVAELEDRWRRAVAELDNQRKRFERRLAESTRAERARTAAAFLPVLDNLELALRHADADPATIVTGVQAVHIQALDVLGGLGYQRIETIGQRFDPALHEAARVVPAGDGVEPGTVVEVHRAGFADDNGTLVRPAVVTVAQPAPAPPASAGRANQPPQQPEQEM